MERVLVIAVNNCFMSHCVTVTLIINSVSPMLRSLPAICSTSYMAKFSSALPQNNNLSANRGKNPISSVGGNRCSSS